MTHMSDFSYLERGMLNFIIFCWILLRIHKTEGLSSLKFQKIFQFFLKPRHGNAPLRLIITTLVLLACFTHIIYDIIVVKFKYEEGFTFNTALGLCVTKEGKDYSPANKMLLDISNTLLSMMSCMKNSASFLLIAFWSHTGLQIGIKKPFVTSRESKICSMWAVISVFLYPILQYSFLSNKLVSTIAPQLLDHFETVFIIGFSILIQYRLRQSITESFGFHGFEILKHHMRCLTFFTLWNFVALIGIAIINMDGVTAKALYSNKFWLDVCIKLYSTGCSGIFVTVIQILYPEGMLSPKNNPSTSQRGPHSVQKNHAQSSDTRLT